MADELCYSFIFLHPFRTAHVLRAYEKFAKRSNDTDTFTVFVSLAFEFHLPNASMVSTIMQWPMANHTEFVSWEIHSFDGLEYCVNGYFQTKSFGFQREWVCMSFSIRMNSLFASTDSWGGIELIHFHFLAQISQVTFCVARNDSHSHCYCFSAKIVNIVIESQQKRL